MTGFVVVGHIWNTKMWFDFNRRAFWKGTKVSWKITLSAVSGRWLDLEDWKWSSHQCVCSSHLQTLWALVWQPSTTKTRMHTDHSATRHALINCLFDRNEQYYESIMSIWSQTYINIKSLISWQYCMKDIQYINSLTLSMVWLDRISLSLYAVYLALCFTNASIVFGISFHCLF